MSLVGASQPVPPVNEAPPSNCRHRNNGKPISATFRNQTRLAHEGSITRRQSALAGLGFLTAFANCLNGRPETAAGAAQYKSGFLNEFGSRPRPLKSTIRVLVPRPPIPRTASEATEYVSVLVVDDIEVTDNSPVRLDVYVAAPPATGDLRVGSDLGELAGSLVDVARYRRGRRSRMMELNLGVSSLLEEMGAQHCEKVMVSLVPRTSNMVVGGVRIENVMAD